jgi:hypothetical protein
MTEYVVLWRHYFKRQVKVFLTILLAIRITQILESNLLTLYI